MRFLGIDYGSKRIGISISNEEGTIAFPHVSIVNNDKAIDKIGDVVKEKDVAVIVMGDTRAFSGAENSVTREAESFARTLSERVGITVEKTWEAWSSREAGRFAPDDVKDDSAAAAIILQRYLEMKKS